MRIAHSANLHWTARAAASLKYVLNLKASQKKLIGGFVDKVFDRPVGDQVGECASREHSDESHVQVIIYGRIIQNKS